MSEKAIELTEANFDQEISEGVTLVDFWAPWCGPCKMMGPVIDGVAEKLGDRATVAKLNVDEARGVAGKFGITSIPAIFIFKDGMPAKQLVGMQQESAIVSAIDEILSEN